MTLTISSGPTTLMLRLKKSTPVHYPNQPLSDSTYISHCFGKAANITTHMPVILSSPSPVGHELLKAHFTSFENNFFPAVIIFLNGPLMCHRYIPVSQSTSFHFFFIFPFSLVLNPHILSCFSFSFALF